MRLALRARHQFDVPPERLFDFTNDAANFVSFTGFGIVPGIRSARYETAEPPRLGSRRRILKTDGTEHLEEIIAFERPVLHVSRITALSPPLAWLVRSGEDAWRFRSEGATRTTLDRTFSFELTSPLVAIVALPLLHLFMRIAVRRDLQNIDRFLRLTSNS